MEIPMGQTQKVTLAYDASDGLLDFYLDDTLIAGNFPSAKGNYDLYRFQLLGKDFSPEGDVFDEFIIGVVPEPATMTLLGIGAVALLRRRR